MKNALAMVSWMIFCLFLPTTATAFAQRGTLAGVAGVPVEGHEIVASFQYQVTKELDYGKVRERLRDNAILVRIGRPLESQMLCRLKEVVRDMMVEKGFTDAEVTHEVTPAGPAHPEQTVKITVKHQRRPTIQAIETHGDCPFSR